MHKLEEARLPTSAVLLVGEKMTTKKIFLFFEDLL